MWPFGRRNPYEERSVDWKVVAGILAVLVLIATGYYALRPKSVWVTWADKSIDPGESTQLFIHIKNTSNAIISDVNVSVHPISPYIIPYAIRENNVDRDGTITIPRLGPGDEVIAKYMIRADSSAPAGKYSIKVSVQFPEKNVDLITKIRVE